MSNIENLIASRFIARSDVKAIQHRDGSWSPHTVTGKRDGEYIPVSRKDLQAHVAGKQTFGHYLLDQNNECKLFAFDIDLREQGVYPEHYASTEIEEWGDSIAFEPREAWKDRGHPARPWMKYQFKMLASHLMTSIQRSLGYPCAAAYSGSKGVHVYGFCGRMTGAEAREMMQIVMEDSGKFEIAHGTNFWQTVDQDYQGGYPNLEIETFPKQDTLEGKSLGNLMRLPLGRNLKSKDPTFFIDMTSPVGEMRPVDPVFALTTSNPWRRPGE